jgi:hypothetical protein
MPSQMMLLAISTPFDRFLDPPELRVGGMKGVYAKLSVAERSGDLAPSLGICMYAESVSRASEKVSSMLK